MNYDSALFVAYGCARARCISHFIFRFSWIRLPPPAPSRRDLPGSLSLRAKYVRGDRVCVCVGADRTLFALPMSRGRRKCGSIEMERDAFHYLHRRRQRGNANTRNVRVVVSAKVPLINPDDTFNGCALMFGRTGWQFIHCGCSCYKQAKRLRQNKL